MFVFQDPKRTERLCRALAILAQEKFGEIDIVASPALGGIVPGYETARWLGAKAIFVERENGKFALRRGFTIEKGAKVLMVEDIITTGLSSRECLEALAREPGTIVGAACLIDRSGGKAEIGVPRVALATLDIPAFPADALPPALAALPATKPGSRPGRGERVTSALRWPLPFALASTSTTSPPCATRAAARGPIRLRAALLAIEAGADSITAHLREDRRHIRDADMAALKAGISKPLNFEMAATDQMLDIALKTRPHAVCLVPEKRTERTTEGGLDVVAGHDYLKPYVAELSRAGIRVSMFIEASRAAA